MSRDRVGLGTSLIIVGLPFAWIMRGRSLVLAGVAIFIAVFGAVIMFLEPQEE